MSKILIFCSNYFSDADANGICVKNLACEMIRRGDIVYIISEAEKTGKIIDENDIHVWGVKDIWFTAFLNKRQNKTVFLENVISIVRFFRGILVALAYPNVSAVRSKEVLKIAKELIIEYGIDTVVGTYRPYESIWSAIEIKKAFPNIKVCTYHLDLLLSPNTSNDLIKKYKIFKGKKALNKELRIVDRVILPESVRTTYESYDKIVFSDFPLFVNNKDIPNVPDFKYDNETINIAYIGSLDANNRNPKALIEALEQSQGIKGKTIILHIWGRINDNKVLTMIQSSSRVLYHGITEHKYTDYLLKHSDFLLNISNKNTNDMIPSKIFQLFSIHKPIINVVQNSNDRSLTYFNRNSFTLNIDASDGKIDLKILEKFIYEFYGKRVEYNDSAYEKSTPGYTVDLIEATGKD